MLWWLSIIFALLAVVGCCYLVLTAILIDRFVRRSRSDASPIFGGGHDPQAAAWLRARLGG